MWERNAVTLVKLYRVAQMYDTDRVKHLSRQALEKELHKNFLSYLPKPNKTGHDNSEDSDTTSVAEQNNGSEEQKDADKTPLARVGELVELIYDATSPVTEALSPILVEACGRYFRILERDHSRAFEKLRLRFPEFCNDLLKGCLNHINNNTTSEESDEIAEYLEMKGRSGLSFVQKLLCLLG